MIRKLLAALAIGVFGLAVATPAHADKPPV